MASLHRFAPKPPGERSISEEAGSSSGPTSSQWALGGGNSRQGSNPQPPPSPRRSGYHPQPPPSVYPSTRAGNKRLLDEDGPTTPTKRRRSNNPEPGTMGSSIGPILRRGQLPSGTQPPLQPFRLIDSMLKHPELCLHLATILEIPDLISLYAISKPFHFIMNSHFTTYIRASATYHAPDSGYIFPWRCYKRLTIKDPGFRPQAPNLSVSRDVPGLRWLQMVTMRHEATLAIIRALKKAGHCMVAENDAVIAIKKIWFTMDLPRSGARIAVMHNPNYWTDKDIFLATFFMVKLDMRFTDPVEGMGETKLRELMLGQRGLYKLHDLLENRLSRLDILKLWVRYDYHPSPPLRHLPILGIPANQIGRGNLEGWGTFPLRLMRPDELVIRESIRRSMGLHLKYVEMLRWGYLMQSEGAPKRKMVRLRDRRPLGEKWDEVGSGKKVDMGKIGYKDDVVETVKDMGERELSDDLEMKMTIKMDD